MSRRHLLALMVPLVVGIASCGGGSSGGPAKDDGVLEIWWNEGYYPEETETVRQAVADWSAETGIETSLVFYSEKDLIQSSESAIAAGTPPDILYGQTLEPSLVPKLAWEGKLADITDVIEPIRDRYSPEALDGVYYLNGETDERSYYAVPIAQQAAHIHYWNDLLASINQTGNDIPQDWNAFWGFWEQAQDSLRQNGWGDDLYGIGLPMSTDATDTSYQFEQFLEAFDVRLLDDSGELLVDDPQVRQGIIDTLTAYTSFYQDGYVPPNAVDWSDPDNNVLFLSGLTVMTPNPTLSIPGSQRQDEVTYRERMATVGWPNKPNGDPMRYVVSIKQVMIFADSPQLQEAKDFVSYFTQPEILSQFVEGAQGRYFPVMPQLLQNPFWTDASDPHISVAAKQFESTRPLYTVVSPAYSQVQAENVWGIAIRSVSADGVSPEEAADTAIAEIKRIFTRWN